MISFSEIFFALWVLFNFNLTDYQSDFEQVRGHLVNNGKHPTSLSLSGDLVFVNINGFDGRQIQVTVVDPRHLGSIVIYLDEDLDGTVDRKILSAYKGTVKQDVRFGDLLFYQSIVEEIASKIKNGEIVCSSCLKV